jgi:F-type H+-transporting ATPase subunit epsilon
MKLFLQLISPTGMLFSGEVFSVSLPGEKGAFAVFPMHAPIISNLTKGYVKYHTGDKEEQKVAVASGFAEVNDNRVTVCVELEK